MIHFYGGILNYEQPNIRSSRLLYSSKRKAMIYDCPHSMHGIYILGKRTSGHLDVKPLETSLDQ